MLGISRNIPLSRQIGIEKGKERKKKKKKGGGGKWYSKRLLEEGVLSTLTPFPSVTWLRQRGIIPWVAVGWGAMHWFIVVAVFADTTIVKLFQIHLQAFSSGPAASLWWDSIIFPFVVMAGRTPIPILGWGRGHSMAITPLLVRRGRSTIRRNL